MDQQAIFVTVRLAASTTLILLLISVPLGYWLANGRTWVKLLVEAAVALPLVLPPTVLGFYLLVLMGSVIFSLPFAVQPITSGFRSVDPEIRAAAELLSASRSRILTRVLLPLIRPFLLTAAILTFTHTVGEFGVVLMIGGGIPGVTRTLSISIYDQVQDFAYAQANRTALLLLGLSFLALLILYGRRQRAGV
jgi:molybdate transport system permease protein